MSQNETQVQTDEADAGVTASEAVAESGTDGGAAEQTTASSPDEQLEALQKERDEYLDQWRRSAAEFQNFRKREERLRIERERNASARLIRKLLPVLDDLHRAAEHVPANVEEQEWVNGVLAIERKLWSVLEQEGVTLLEAQPGTQFDPTVHEALISQEHEEIEPEHIIAELERGYRHHETVLRPARVSVAR